jgi:hypothetical protein
LLDVKQFFLRKIRFHTSFSRLRQAVKLLFKTSKSRSKTTDSRPKYSPKTPSALSRTAFLPFEKHKAFSFKKSVSAQ